MTNNNDILTVKVTYNSSYSTDR